MRAHVWVAVLALMAGVGHAAGIYKWVDGAGHVHYGDRPPDAAARALQLRAAPPPDARVQEHLQQQRKLLRAMDEDRRVEQDAQATAAHREELRRQNCARARQQLADYGRATYLYEYDATGRRRVLSDAERTAAKARVQAQVQRWCGE